MKFATLSNSSQKFWNEAPTLHSGSFWSKLVRRITEDFGMLPLWGVRDAWKRCRRFYSFWVFWFFEAWNWKNVYYILRSFILISTHILEVSRPDTEKCQGLFFGSTRGDEIKKQGIFKWIIQYRSVTVAVVVVVKKYVLPREILWERWMTRFQPHEDTVQCHSWSSQASGSCIGQDLPLSYHCCHRTSLWLSVQEFPERDGWSYIIWQPYFNKDKILFHFRTLNLDVYTRMPYFLLSFSGTIFYKKHRNHIKKIIIIMFCK